MDFLSGGMIVPRYISMATGDVMHSMGRPSTLSTRVLYLWLYAKIVSFSPCLIAFNLMMAWVVVGMSLNICSTFSIRSVSDISLSSADRKFCTTNPDLLVSSC